MKSLRVLDLFSGIGGFSLGLERAGMETVAFCEQDKFCQKVLRKHWPEVPIHDDIKTLDGTKYRGTVELVCGGFPCQPFSRAGKQLGAEDDRFLWPEMVRVIDEARPTWVCGENVAGIVGVELDRVLSDLDSIGYESETLVIPACAVDAPHRRDRVWIIAYSNELGNGQQHKYAQERGDSERPIPYVPNTKKRNDRKHNAGENKRQKFKSGKESCSTALADAERARLEGLPRNVDRGHEPGWNKAATPRPARATSVCDGGFAVWPPEPAICRVAHGVPNRSHRIKSLGNAVVPQVVEAIGRAIMESCGKNMAIGRR